MNKHVFLDRLTIRMGALLTGGNGYFARNIDSPPIGETLSTISIDLPEWSGESLHELRVETFAGTLDPGFEVVRWSGPDEPTIIFHHGNNERPFDYRKTAKNTFRSIFLDRTPYTGMNLINLRAPFHNGTIGSYTEAMTDITNFVTMIAASAVLIDGLVKTLRDRGSREVNVSGISLGGWITNIHRAYFGSADRYIPIFAGAALADTFLYSDYRRLVSNTALSHPEEIEEILDFEDDFLKAADGNVYPLLARHDRMIRFERQRRSYPEGSVRVMDTGHVTGVLGAVELRQHIGESITLPLPPQV